MLTAWARWFDPARKVRKRRKMHERRRRHEMTSVASMNVYFYGILWQPSHFHKISPPGKRKKRMEIWFEGPCKKVFAHRYEQQEINKKTRPDPQVHSPRYRVSGINCAISSLYPGMGDNLTPLHMQGTALLYDVPRKQISSRFLLERVHP